MPFFCNRADRPQIEPQIVHPFSRPRGPCLSRSAKRRSEKASPRTPKSSTTPAKSPRVSRNFKPPRSDTSGSRKSEIGSQVGGPVNQTEHPTGRRTETKQSSRQPLGPDAGGGGVNTLGDCWLWACLCGLIIVGQPLTFETFVGTHLSLENGIDGSVRCSFLSSFPCDFMLSESFRCQGAKRNHPSCSKCRNRL